MENEGMIQAAVFGDGECFRGWKSKDFCGSALPAGCFVILGKSSSLSRPQFPMLNRPQGFIVLVP